jgi:hypothetical protein
MVRNEATLYRHCFHLSLEYDIRTIHENLEGMELNTTHELLVNANDAGFYVLTAQVMKSSIFWDIITRGPLTTGTCHLYIQCRIGEGSCKHRSLAYSSTLKMEATRSSEMSYDFQRTTWRYMAENRTFKAKDVMLLG